MRIFAAASLFLSILAVSIDPQLIAVATYTVDSPPLLVDGDNEPSLSAWLNSLPDGSKVTLPAGTWKLGKGLKVMRKLQMTGAGIAETKLVCQSPDGTSAALEIGDYGRDIKTNGFILRKMTVEQQAAGAGVHNCVVVHGDDFLTEDVKFLGSHHEGVVVHGDCRRATARRCLADSCGNGNATYSQSTAGFNIHAHPTIYEDCRATNCGQGYEIDGYHSRVRRCFAENPSGVEPSIAFNVGSSGVGIYDVELSRCRSKGYNTGFVCGNGIGRLANVNVHDCVFDGGEIGMCGGVSVNRNPGLAATLGEECPDTGQSHFDRNVIIARTSQYGILGYSGGPAAVNGELGREPFTWNDNSIYVVGSISPTSPILYAGGRVDKLQINRTKIYHLNSAPLRGDFQSFTNNFNVPAPGQPGITLQDNVAFTENGDEREFVIKREGVAQ